VLSEKAVNAKRIIEYYTDLLNEEESSEAVFTTQFSNLHMLKFRIQATLDALESYEIKVE